MCAVHLTNVDSREGLKNIKNGLTPSNSSFPLQRLYELKNLFAKAVNHGKLWHANILGQCSLFPNFETMRCDGTSVSKVGINEELR